MPPNVVGVHCPVCGRMSTNARVGDRCLLEGECPGIMEQGFVAPPTFDDWLDAGRAAGFVVDTFCAAHDGPPLTEAEMAAAEAHDMDPLDICAPSIRVQRPRDVAAREPVLRSEPPVT